MPERVSAGQEVDPGRRPPRIQRFWREGGEAWRVDMLTTCEQWISDEMLAQATFPLLAVEDEVARMLVERLWRHLNRSELLVQLLDAFQSVRECVLPAGPQRDQVERFQELLLAHLDQASHPPEDWLLVRPPDRHPADD
jgi:hypothetical protein